MSLDVEMSGEQKAEDLHPPEERTSESSFTPLKELESQEFGLDYYEKKEDHPNPNSPILLDEGYSGVAAYACLFLLGAYASTVSKWSGFSLGESIAPGLGVFQEVYKHAYCRREKQRGA